MSAAAFDDDGDAVIEMDQLPPRWLDVQDEITDILGEIGRQTKDLEQLHQKHVLPGFDDEAVKKREERDIEQLTQLITRNFQKCQKSIQRIEAMVREAKRLGNFTNTEETMARNLKISLASRVGEASAVFRKKQSAYLKSETENSPSYILILTNSNRTSCAWRSSHTNSTRLKCISKWIY